MEKTNWKIPQAWLDKLYNLTGDTINGKGFILFAFDGEGRVVSYMPTLLRQSESLALRKGAQIYLEKLDNLETCPDILSDANL